MKTSLLRGAAVLALGLACAFPAAAQSIDYGALEQLFGEPVTTSATGSPQRATEAPVDMTIISADEIKRSGATDIPTILSRLAGVDVLNFSATTTDVGMRGYDQGYSPRLLVLVNGRQVYLDTFAVVVWSALPVALSEIRQIEVVRGPNSAVFGFNAVGGVINIITFNPKYDAKNSLEAHGGAGDKVGGSGVVTFHLGDRLSARLSAGAEREDEWSTKGSILNPADIARRPWSKRANLDAVAQLGAKTELRLEGSLVRTLRNDGLPNDGYAFSRYHTNSAKVALTSETRLGLVQLMAYQNKLVHILTIPPTPTSPPQHNRIQFVSVQDLFKVGANHTVRIGGEYRDNVIDTVTGSGAHFGYSVLAPSAMWNWRVTPGLSVTAAARLDRLNLRRTGGFLPGLPLADNAFWDRSFTKLSANLGLILKLTDLDTLRLSYARGAQIPSLLEYGGIEDVLPQYGIGLVGNPTERPAIVANYQVSYDRSFPEANAKIAAKAFYQHTSDVKGQFSFREDIPATATTFAATSYYNVSDSKMWGVELSARGLFGDGFRWSLDSSYTDITDHPFPGKDLVELSSAYARTTPKIRGNAALGWSDDRWAVDGYLHYVGKAAAYDTSSGFSVLEPAPAFVTLAGRIAYETSDGLVFALSGQNLLNQRQIQVKRSGLWAERRIWASISKEW